MCDDPALVLHLTVLLLFQSVTQTMLQASGRFVSTILQFLTTHLSQDVNGCLQKYHGNLTFFCISCVLTLKITNLSYTNILKVILQVGLFGNAINFYSKISFRSAEQSGLICSLLTILFCSQLHEERARYTQVRWPEHHILTCSIHLVSYRVPFLGIGLSIIMLLVFHSYYLNVHFKHSKCKHFLYFLYDPYTVTAYFVLGTASCKETGNCIKFH